MNTPTLFTKEALDFGMTMSKYQLEPTNAIRAIMGRWYKPTLPTIHKTTNTYVLTNRDMCIQYAITYDCGYKRRANLKGVIDNVQVSGYGGWLIDMRPIFDQVPRSAFLDTLSHVTSDQPAMQFAMEQFYERLNHIAIGLPVTDMVLYNMFKPFMIRMLEIYSGCILFGDKMLLVRSHEEQSFDLFTQELRTWGYDVSGIVNSAVISRMEPFEFAGFKFTGDEIDIGPTRIADLKMNIKRICGAASTSGEKKVQQINVILNNCNWFAETCNIINVTYGLRELDSYTENLLTRKMLAEDKDLEPDLACDRIGWHPLEHLARDINNKL